MFVLPKSKGQRLDIYVWLESVDQLEDQCRQQAVNLANLPCNVHHVVLLPDTHTGYGMPIGGVVASQDAIIPNAVGVDIGCGVAYVDTGVVWEGQDRKKLMQRIVEDILRVVPTGFRHHKKPQQCAILDQYEPRKDDPKELLHEIGRGYNQVGTLGSGNHFIEIQKDIKTNELAIMVHSGSRNFGYKVCNYYAKRAKEQQQQLPDRELAYFHTDTPQGRGYLRWMALALGFARENRNVMLERVKDVVAEHLYKHWQVEPKFSKPINAHHNYASQEEVKGEKLWIHRKGAISARKDELGIIPGAMGSFSYIVRGLGCEKSFQSCSHGAGRRLGRKEAMRTFSKEEVLDDMKRQGLILGKVRLRDVAEEYRLAYKDIDEVIAEQLDLITPIKKLESLATVKG
ncbi:MAG: RtcB family protein [Limnochordia bacterium]|nr:RtcB family protein [Limnochordia bacterium]